MSEQTASAPKPGARKPPRVITLAEEPVVEPTEAAAEDLPTLADIKVSSDAGPAVPQLYNPFAPKEYMVGVMFEENGSRDYFKAIDVEVHDGLLVWTPVNAPQTRKYVSLVKLSSLEIEAL